MDLRANAIITAVDRFSGPMQRMAAVMNRFSGQAAVVANASKRAGAAVGGFGLTGAMGFGLLLQQAEKFNRAVFGVGVASVGEAMDKFGNVDVSRMTGDMERIERSSMNMSQKLRLSATTVSEIHETLAKAGLPAERLAAAAEATAILAKTDFETPANKMAEFMHVISIIHKPLEGESFGDFMRRQADMVNIAASETRLSVGGIMEGLRQFQPIGATMGLKTEEMLALIMAGVRSGFNPIELGTALKSSMSRAWKPTAGGMFALNSVLGPMGKSLNDYTASTAQDPRRATASLHSSLGYVKGPFRTQIEKMLYDAYRGGYTASEGFIQDLTRTLAKEGGFNDLKDLQTVENSVRSSVLVPGQQIDILRMWKDFIKGGGDIAQFVNYFEGRHLARLLPIMEALKEMDGDSPFNRDVTMLQRAKGQGLDAVETLWGKSAFGNMKAMAAAWERIMLRLANSPGIQQFVNGLERIAAAIERADPLVVQMGAWGGIIALLAGPAAMIAGGLAAAFGLLAVALASPIAVPILAIGSAALLLKDGFHPAVVTAFALAMGGLALALSPVTVSILILGGTALLLMANWEPVKQFFADLWESIKSGFQSLLDWISSGIDRLFALFDRLRGAGGAIWGGRFGDAWDMLKGGDLPRTSNNDRMEPLARTGDELIRSLTGGTGRLEVQGQATITNRVQVEFINGVPVVREAPAGQTQVPLRTGTSLGDVGPAP